MNKKKSRPVQSARLPFHSLDQLTRKKKNSRLKIGLALSGGVCYGVSQIGVLKVLEKAHIAIDCLAGTSAGAIIAAAYASGLTCDQIEHLGIQTKWKDFFSFHPSRMGLVSSAAIEDYIRKYLKVEKFKDLKKPLAVVATDICSGNEVIFTHGSLAKAVRASCSIPGIYAPVDYAHHQLVDGGMSENVPVRALKALGADMIIAVNVLGKRPVFELASNVFQVLTRVWYFFVEQQETWKKNSDIQIEMNLNHYDLFDFSAAKEMISLGELETQKCMHEIQKKIYHKFYFQPEIYW